MSRCARHLLTILVFLGFASSTLAWRASAQAPAPRNDAPTRALAVHVAPLADSAQIVVDGQLNEPAWHAISPVTGFVQIEPSHGTPATLDTEVRVTTDARFLYVAMRAHDPAGRRGMRVRDLRRDFAWGRSDAMGFVLDGLGDGRSILAFGVSPLGAQWDAQVTDGGLSDFEWDATWHVRAQIDDAGWSAEFAIPWSVLRYAPDLTQWRVNFVREVTRLGESSSLAPYPRALGPFRMDYAGTMHDVTPPRAGARLLVQPYAVTSRRTVGTPASRVALGGELKWQPSVQSTVDLTLNTDFAQANVDRQVVNLTRFSPFFPERRPFFLENRGLFTMGAAERLLPFFTRRIGLTDTGTPIPIDAGVRLLHRGAEWSGAGLLVRQRALGDTPAATIGVVRSQRTLKGGWRAGTLLVERLDDATTNRTSEESRTVAIDLMGRPRPSVTLNAMLTGTAGRGREGDGVAAWAEVQRATSAVTTAGAFEYVGDGYRPTAGFVARRDVVRTSARVVGDLRPRWRPDGVRGLRPSLALTSIWRARDRTFQEGQLVGRLLGVDFLDTSRLWIDATGEQQVLDRPFDVMPGLRIPTGRYTVRRVEGEYQSSVARPLQLVVGGAAGGYFDGGIVRTSARVAWAPDPRIVVDASHVRAALRHVGGRADTHVTHLLASELRLAVNPRLQLTAFYQHNTAMQQGSLNARLVWEYQPLSTLAIVYSGREPLRDAFQSPSAVTRDGQLVVKWSWTRQP